MFFFPLTRAARARHRTAASLYGACVEQSRKPVFYTELAVPDTFDGRFELTALHVGLTIERLARAGQAGEGGKLAQALFDEMFVNLDQTCREIGIGDLGVPRHIKRMMQALKGRAMAYREGLSQTEGGGGNLTEALQRNLYGTLETVPPEKVMAAMAAYVEAFASGLELLQDSDFQSGRLAFPALPEIKGVNHGQTTQRAA